MSRNSSTGSGGYSSPLTTGARNDWSEVTTSSGEDDSTEEDAHDDSEFSGVTFRTTSESELSDVPSWKRREKKRFTVKTSLPQKFSVVMKTAQRRLIGAVSVEASSINMFIEGVKYKFSEKCAGDEVDSLLLEITKGDEIELEEGLVDFDFLTPAEKYTVIVNVKPKKISLPGWYFCCCVYSYGNMTSA